MLAIVPVALPLLMAAVLAALSKVISDRISQLISIATALTVLSASICLLKRSALEPIVYWFGNWHPRHGLALGISFVIDPIGAGLSGFAALLMVAAFIFASEYFDSAANHFHALMLAFLGSMCGFALTGDLFNLFVFFELMSAAGFALCGYKTDDPASLQGALNFAVTNTIAAYFVLIGIGLIYARTSALNLAQIGRSLAHGPVDTLVLIGFVFLVGGYLVKAAVVPFHFWLADAHAVAPTPVCVLFSGVMVGMGLFALARIYWTAFDPAFHASLPKLAMVFVDTGAMTAVVGACMCYLQRNFKRLLAFSTISHVGLMLIGIGLFSPEGLAGTTIYTIGHGLVKGSLFLLAGILLHRFETLDEHDLHGKAKREWGSGAILLLGALGLAGIPFSGLATGHDLIADAAQRAGWRLLPWVFVFAGAVTSAAVLRAGGHIFLGCGPVRENADEGVKCDEKPETQGGHDQTPVMMFIPAAALLIAGLLLGVLPHLQQSVVAAAGRFENSRAYAAQVLDGVPAAAARNGLTAPQDWIMALTTILAGFAIAAVTLVSPGGGKIHEIVSLPIRLLHRIHSGHIGDYVTFLVLGMGCLALVCVYCLS